MAWVSQFEKTGEKAKKTDFFWEGKCLFEYDDPIGKIVSITFLNWSCLTEIGLKFKSTLLLFKLLS